MALPFLIVPLIIASVFAFIVIGLLVQGVKGLAEWSRNNASPVETLLARVVSKRSEVSGRNHRHRHGGRVWTVYHATFELPQGERLEFEIAGRESGLLVEGDAGLLRYQGSRYLGFQRTLQGSKPAPDFLS